MSKPKGRELLQDIMPSLVSKFDPGRHFHPSSPWGGEDWPTGNYTLAGDYHDYWTYRFQPNATVPLFTGEVCMVSPYSLHHMKRFMPEEEIWPEDFRFSINQPGKIAWPDGWEKHRTTDAWEKIGKIQDYCDIENAADMCRVFGTAHGQYLRDRYERQRRGIPDGMPDGNRRSWGAAIWRLNDTWPIIYMSVIDYYLEPKIPYYFLKRACDPLLLTFEQTDERISSWVVNDSPEIVNDSLVVELWTFNGTMKRRLAWKVDLQPGESKRVANLTVFHEIRKRDEFFVASIEGREVTHLLWPEKYLNLSQAEIKAEWYGEKIVLRSDVFVKDVELHLEGTSGAIYSENFFNLVPGQSKEIRLLHDPGGDKLIIKGVNSVKLVLNR
ncbi:glycoside hydrolase family 2 protein [Bacteroidota bacterium]